jgi:hypothetical protein
MFIYDQMFDGDRDCEICCPEINLNANRGSCVQVHLSKIVLLFHHIANTKVKKLF